MTMEGAQSMEYFQPRTKPNFSTVPFVSRPANRQTFLVFASEQNGFEALVHVDVGIAISEKAEKAFPNETIGLLAGRILRDERGPYTLVLKSEGARSNEIEASPSHVRISANGQAQVRSRLETSAYGLDIIGWYHSHPKFSARFSSEDLIEQSTWRDPNHIGIVISGIDHATPLGLYRGPQAMFLTPTSLPPPPPTPPPAALTTTSAPSRSTKSLPLEVWRTTRKVSVSFLPAALFLVVLGMLFAVVRINEKIVRLESALYTVASELHVSTATPATANPAAPPDPNQNQVINAVRPPDLVNKQGTKALMVPSSKIRQLDSKANKRGAVARKPKPPSPRPDATPSNP